MGMFHLSEEDELYFGVKKNKDEALQFMHFLYTLVRDPEVVVQAATDWYIEKGKELYFSDNVEIHNRRELEDYFRMLLRKEGY